MTDIRAEQPCVLIVDDEPDLRQLLTDVLESEGCQVVRAANGAEALEKITQQRPDLIVLDLMMPVLDGWSFMNSYVAVAGTQIPIISLSAVLSDAAMERLERLGVRCCLAKPFDLTELLTCASRLLGPRCKG